MKKSQITLLILSLCTLFACNQSKQSLSEDQMNAIVSKSTGQLMILVSNKDSDSLTKVFAADASIYPPGEAESKGIVKIQNWYKSAYEYGLCGIKYQVNKVYGTDEQIIETGTAEFISTITGTNDTVDIGDYNYLNVWSKKNDSTYVLRTQMWNEGASNQ
jgi:hypothetical protein